MEEFLKSSLKIAPCITNEAFNAVSSNTGTRMRTASLVTRDKVNDKNPTSASGKTFLDYDWNYPF